MSKTGVRQNKAVYEAAFKAAYGRLNASQKEAVDAIEGPVMVLAGPGTGKTQILTLRIANILQKTDTAPEQILALTFTDSGARAMRERLFAYIGSASYRVEICTFHAFAEKCIRMYPDAYDQIIGGTAATDLEKIHMISTILDDPEIRLLRPSGNPTYYVSHILREISGLKKENIRPSDFARIIEKEAHELTLIEKIHTSGAHKGKVRGEYSKKERSLQKNLELHAVYVRYEAFLKDARVYDYDDMILETITALERDETFLRELQESYTYLLADEHQDVNGSQNRILELLASYHENPNIFVVGDEKQAIYRFQGASLENFLYFENTYPGTRHIALTDNYRSGQTILDAAHSLVHVEEGPLAALRVPLVSAREETGVVERHAFSHEAIEDTALIARIEALIQEGRSPEDIAIIVRTNREVEQITALLRKHAIAANPTADTNILEHPITHTIEGMLRAIVAPEDEMALFTLVHGAYWGLSADDIVRVCSARSFSLPLSAIISDETALVRIGVSKPQNILRIYEVLKEARLHAINEAPHRVLAYVLRESGFLSYIIETDPQEGGRVIRRIYDEIERMVVRERTATLSSVCEAFQLQRAYGVALNAPYIDVRADAVLVTTAHKAKGLEFGVVYMPHLHDSIWGGRRMPQYFDIPKTTHLKTESFDELLLDDERRLLYVGMTRAKDLLILSYAEQNNEGKSLLASRLLDDLAEEYVSNISTTDKEEAFVPVSMLMKEQNTPVLDTSFLATHLAHYGFSATSFNNYVKSPWEYIYRNVLRVPEPKTESLLFGTAMHGVLEAVFKEFRSQKSFPDSTRIKTLLEQELSLLPLSEHEYIRLHEKGFEALSVYLPHIAASPPYASKTEWAVSVQFETGVPELPVIPLKGTLDRLDFDAHGRVIAVVDYKTGKPKTRNAILGATKNEDGGYKRQLVFYALLLSLYEDDAYQCQNGIISFVQPNTKAVIREELFTSTTEELDALKALLRQAVKDIVTGASFDAPCDPLVCHYCHFVEALHR